MTGKFSRYEEISSLSGANAGWVPMTIPTITAATVPADRNATDLKMLFFCSSRCSEGFGMSPKRMWKNQHNWA